MLAQSSALRLRAARGQGAPPWAAEQLLITLEGEPGVGDRRFAPQRLEQPLRAGVGGFRQPGVDLGVDRRIDPADEEAGHAGDPCRIAAPRDQRFEPGDVRLRHALVGILREEQRHVDVDAFRDQLPEGRDALAGGRYLDHQVRTPHRGPQAPRFCERARRVEGEQGRHLQADVTVAPVRLVVHAAEQIGGVLDIPDRQLLVQRRGVDRGGARRLEEVGIVRAAGDRLLEDGGVGGHPAEAVLLDQPLQLAAGDQAAPDVIEPDRLPEHLERAHRAFERGHLGEAAQMPGLAAERRVQKGVHHFARQLAADHATAEHEHVHVVVLDPLVRGIGVVAQAGADAGNAVGRHRGADAAAAQDDPAIGAVFAQGGADGRRVVCIIDGLAGMSADIEHLFVLPCEECLQCFLQLEPGVIRSDRDPHLNSPGGGTARYIAVSRADRQRSPAVAVSMCRNRVRAITRAKCRASTRGCRRSWRARSRGVRARRAAATTAPAQRAGAGRGDHRVVHPHADCAQPRMRFLTARTGGDGRNARVEPRHTL